MPAQHQAPADESAEREKFELWAKANTPLKFERDLASYFSGTTQFAWLAWMERAEEVSAHVEAGEMPAGRARDWPEDFADENGMYMNRCSTCGEIFIGYKRRVTCKVCAERMLPETAAAPKGEAGEMEPAKEDRK